MKKLKPSILLLAMLFFSAMVRAQNTSNESNVGQIMRSNGRIYVVLAVMLTILIGLFIYLVIIDRKVRKMEKSV
jgi:hypothetical protein